MSRFLGRYSPIAYALMRIIFGLLLACHGGQKILGMFGGMHGPGGALTTVAGIIELVGGFLIAFGLFADWVAFLASGLMAVAYFMVHAGGGFFPIVNHGELAVLYCFVFLYIAFHGSGILRNSAATNAIRRTALRSSASRRQNAHAAASANPRSASAANIP